MCWERVATASGRRRVWRDRQSQALCSAPQAGAYRRPLHSSLHRPRFAPLFLTYVLSFNVFDPMCYLSMSMRSLLTKLAVSLGRICEIWIRRRTLLLFEWCTLESIVGACPDFSPPFHLSTTTRPNRTPPPPQRPSSSSSSSSRSSTMWRRRRRRRTQRGRA